MKREFVTLKDTSHFLRKEDYKSDYDGTNNDIMEEKGSKNEKCTTYV